MPITDKYQYLSADELKSMQNGAFNDLIHYLKSNSNYYKKQLADTKFPSDKIYSIDDIKIFPLTTKEDLHTHINNFYCVEKNQIAEFVSTSGTTGRPLFYGLTENDIERLALNEFGTFALAGCTQESVIQIITTLDRRFLAGLAYYLGGRKIGATIIRTGIGVPEMQWETIVQLKPDTIVAVPSFILKLIEYAKKNHIILNESSVKKAICIGEAIYNGDGELNSLGKSIKNEWNINLYSTYASTEMATAFSSCEAGVGCHHQPHLIYFEILNEEGQEVLPGEKGELVITTFGIKGLPLLRFKTGDITFKYKEPCSCGRTTDRIGPVIGRKGQLIKIKGTSIYPNSIFEVLDEIKEIDLYQVECSLDKFGNDALSVFYYSENDSGELREEIKTKLQSRLRVTPELQFLTKEKIYAQVFPEQQRKAIKFNDTRKN